MNIFFLRAQTIFTPLSSSILNRRWSVGGSVGAVDGALQKNEIYSSLHINISSNRTHIHIHSVYKRLRTSTTTELVMCHIVSSSSTGELLLLAYSNPAFAFAVNGGWWWAFIFTAEYLSNCVCIKRAEYRTTIASPRSFVLVGNKSFYCFLYWPGHFPIHASNPIRI